MPQFDEVFRKLTAELGHEPIDRIWVDLVHWHHHQLRRALNDPSALAAVRDVYLDKAENYGVSGPASRKRQSHERRALPPDARLEALGRIAAAQARLDPLVMEYRRLHLPEGLLEEMTYRPWLQEQERAYASPPESCHVRVPLDDLAFMYRSGLLADPEGRADSQPYLDRLRYWRAHAREYGSNQPNAILWTPEACAWWLRRFADKVLSGEQEVPRHAWHDEMLHYPEPAAPRGVGFVWIGEDGPLVDLKKLARHLKTWLPWSEPEVVEFLLTDQAPQLLRASMEADLSAVPALSRLRLVVDPRVPSRVVAQLYEQGRAEFAKGKDAPMKEKSVELAVFGAEHLGTELDWREMCERWNEAHADLRYDQDRDGSVRRFGRDTRASYQRVVGRRWTDDHARAMRGTPIYSGLSSLPVARLDPEAERVSYAPGFMGELVENIPTWTYEGEGDEGAP